VIVVLAVGIPILVAIAFAWFRAAADRRNRRSMRRYGSALDRLGDVARRSDAVAPVQVPSPDAIARPHFGIEPPASPWVEPEATILQPIVKPPLVPSTSSELPVFDDVSPSGDSATGAGTDTGTAAALARMVARSRSAHEATSPPSPARHPEDTESVRLRRLASQTLQFSDLDVVLNDEDVDATSGGSIARLGPRRGRLPVVMPPRERAIRRRLIGAGAVVAVLVVVGIVIVIAVQHRGSPPASSTTTTVVSNSKGTQSSTTTSLPSVLRPTSATPTLVVYDVPTKSYVVRFSATAACWLGSQKSESGPYLWMDTLSAGQSTTYSATGTRIIRLGAPKAVTLTINGIPVALPASNVLSYMLKLQPAVT
jgi:hypothetical protein